MPYKDKEKRKEYDKLRREKNKEKNKECIRLWREKNKEKIKEQKKEYYKKNNKTENGKKSIIIKGWKRRGVINDDFDKLYDHYLNCKNCEECKIELVNGNKSANHKCLDHNHETGEFRNVVCHGCNIRRGIKDRGTIKLTQAERSWKCKLRAFILS